MSRESAGAAIRALRESRDWSLAELAAATGVSIMGLSIWSAAPVNRTKVQFRRLKMGLAYRRVPTRGSWSLLIPTPSWPG